jgi:uncharacterized protein (TIGR00251 family)
MTHPWCKDHRWKDTPGTLLQVLAKPGAKRSEILGVQGDFLKIAIQAPPVDGAANEALIRFLAEALGVKRQQIELLSGDASRQKRLFLSGLSADRLVRMALPGPVTPKPPRGPD